MKKSRFTETQIVAMLQQYDSGMKVTDICRDKGITTATFYSWKRKYGGMDAHQQVLSYEGHSVAPKALLGS